MQFKLDIISECRECSHYRSNHNPDRYCLELKKQVDPFVIDKDCPLKTYDYDESKKELMTRYEQLKLFTETGSFNNDEFRKLCLEFDTVMKEYPCIKLVGLAMWKFSKNRSIDRKKLENLDKNSMDDVEYHIEYLRKT